MEEILKESASGSISAVNDAIRYFSGSIERETDLYKVLLAFVPQYLDKSHTIEFRVLSLKVVVLVLEQLSNVGSNRFLIWTPRASVSSVRSNLIIQILGKMPDLVSNMESASNVPYVCEVLCDVVTRINSRFTVNDKGILLLIDIILGLLQVCPNKEQALGTLRSVLLTCIRRNMEIPKIQTLSDVFDRVLQERDYPTIILLMKLFASNEPAQNFLQRVWRASRAFLYIILYQGHESADAPLKTLRMLFEFASKKADPPSEALFRLYAPLVSYMYSELQESEGIESILRLIRLPTERILTEHANAVTSRLGEIFLGKKAVENVEGMFYIIGILVSREGQDVDDFISSARMMLMLLVKIRGKEIHYRNIKHLASGLANLFTSNENVRRHILTILMVFAFEQSGESRGELYTLQELVVVMFWKFLADTENADEYAMHFTMLLNKVLASKMTELSESKVNRLRFISRRIAKDYNLVIRNPTADVFQNLKHSWPAELLLVDFDTISKDRGFLTAALENPVSRQRLYAKNRKGIQRILKYILFKNSSDVSGEELAFLGNTLDLLEDSDVPSVSRILSQKVANNQNLKELATISEKSSKAPFNKSPELSLFFEAFRDKVQSPESVGATESADIPKRYKVETPKGKFPNVFLLNPFLEYLFKGNGAEISKKIDELESGLESLVGLAQSSADKEVLNAGLERLAKRMLGIRQDLLE